MRKLVLLGTGRAHLDLLSTLASKQPAGLQLTLIATYPLHLCNSMVPGLVAGQHALDDCVISLETLLQKAGARWLKGSVAALDVKENTLHLTDGSTFGFDWLSIDTGALQNRQQIEAAMPGAREHGLFVRPLHAFCALWPKVTELAGSRSLRIAVMGSDRMSVELALAMRQRLPGSSVTLLAGTAGLVGALVPDHAQHILKLLKEHRVTVLPDLAIRIEAEQVLLAGGARLACDVPIIATTGQAPAWLAESALTLDTQGKVALDAFGRSVSHPQVFASNESPGRAKPALSTNVLSLLAGSPARRRQSPPDRLTFVACGGRHALLLWHGFSVHGRWVGWLKNWLERRYLRPYRRD